MIDRQQAVTIRAAAEADAETLVRLVRALAAFEGMLHQVRMEEADILRDGFREPRRFECLLAEIGGEPVGFALFFHNYSTFEGRPGIHLEDIYVAEQARGRGVGRRLLARLARVAEDRGCRRFDLAVLNWNPARAFYARLGFRQLEAWLPYRLEGEALRRLAAEDRETPPGT